MAVYFGFWAISLGLVAAGSLASVGSDYPALIGLLGIIILIGWSIHRGVHRWSWVFGLIGVGFLMTGLGNSLSYIKDDGEVVDNLLMPYGAITITIGILFAAYLTILFVGHRLYSWVHHVKD